MNIIRRQDKRERRYSTKQTDELVVKLAVTKSDRTLLRFDKYCKPGTTNPVEVEFKQWKGDEAFAVYVLETPDPRYGTFKLSPGMYPAMFRSRSVQFECRGQHKTTGEIETLFYGQIDIIPMDVV